MPLTVNSADSFDKIDNHANSTSESDRSGFQTEAKTRMFTRPDSDRLHTSNTTTEIATDGSQFRQPPSETSISVARDGTSFYGESMTDNGSLKSGLIAGVAALLLLVSVGIFLVSRKKLRKMLFDKEELSSPTENIREIHFFESERAIMRNVDNNEDSRCNESNAKNSIPNSHREIHYNVLYGPAEQEAEYAVIDGGAHPEQSPNVESNQERVVYAVIDESNVETIPAEETIPSNSPEMKRKGDLYASVNITKDGEKSTVHFAKET